jgi:hypothetical protein
MQLRVGGATRFVLKIVRNAARITDRNRINKMATAYVGHAIYNSTGRRAPGSISSRGGAKKQNSLLNVTHYSLSSKSKPLRSSTHGAVRLKCAHFFAATKKQKSVTNCKRC